MRRGTTTMKMISSTSTTSTSGVILISDCRLEPAPLLTCMMSFSRALGDQPHARKAGLLDCVHGLPHLAEVELCVASDHHFGVRIGGYCRTKNFPELVGRGRRSAAPPSA